MAGCQGGMVDRAVWICVFTTLAAHLVNVFPHAVIEAVGAPYAAGSTTAAECFLVNCFLPEQQGADTDRGHKPSVSSYLTSCGAALVSKDVYSTELGDEHVRETTYGCQLPVGRPWLCFAGCDPLARYEGCKGHRVQSRVLML